MSENSDKFHHWGLIAHPVVFWLIKNDTDVSNYFKMFIAGRVSAVLTVAGPPSVEETRRWRASGGLLRKGGKIELPTVKLELSKTTKLLTGEPCVKVRCTDEDIATMTGWELRSGFTRHEALDGQRKVLAGLGH